MFAHIGHPRHFVRGEIEDGGAIAEPLTFDGLCVREVEQVFHVGVFGYLEVRQEILAHDCQSWTRHSSALGVLVRGVVDGVEHIGGGGGLLDHLVVRRHDGVAILRQATLDGLIEVHLDVGEFVQHRLTGVFVPEFEEATGVNAERLRQHRRDFGEELIHAERSKVIRLQGAAVHPVAALTSGDEDADDLGIVVVGDARQHSTDEHQSTFEGVDGRVRFGVCPDAGRNDFDLDGVGADFRERLIGAHGFILFHDTCECITTTTTTALAFIVVAVPAFSTHG